VSKDTLYFDGQCGLCQRSTRILRALDWFGRLAFEDMTRVPEGDLPVPIEAAMRGIPMRTRDGRALVGFPALLQTPIGFLPALVLFVPGISALGAWVYDRIAANRGRMACAAPHRGN
jgi:predicted DCC family thiol-disulfide oxidoreductase YuxK